jgi:hypothetical protein
MTNSARKPPKLPSSTRTWPTANVSISSTSAQSSSPRTAPCPRNSCPTPSTFPPRATSSGTKPSTRKSRN